MNSYELAKYLATESPEAISYRFACGNAAIMLRQQADRIAELEQTNQEMSDLYEAQLDKKADRIAKLEKLLGQNQDYIASWEDEPQAEELYEIIESNKEVSSKPVAYEESLEEMLDFLLHQGFGNKYIEGFEDGADWFKCTHPVKQLSDEEIKKIWNDNLAIMGNDLQFARAIIKEITE